MKSPLLIAVMATLLLGVCSAHCSPVRGQYRAKERLEAGRNLEYRETFRANERACVIIEGDHNPVMNLKVRVLDPAGNTIASDLSGGDLLVVTWYPARTQEYTITISSDGDTYNILNIVLK